MTKIQMMTNRGYDYFEVISALQKSIRRGLEYDAMYWAAELYHSGYDKALWKRLRVVASEDVGLAEPMMPATIHALHETYWDVKRGSDGQPSERLMLTQAVLLLTRARKSRVVCHASIYHIRGHEYAHLQIPDWALDQHTKAGKRKGRGLDHFFAEGALLANEGDVEHEAQYLVLARETLASEHGPGLFPESPSIDS